MLGWKREEEKKKKTHKTKRLIGAKIYLDAGGNGRGSEELGETGGSEKPGLTLGLRLE